MSSEITLARLALVYPDVRVRAIRLYEDVRLATGRELNCAVGLRDFAEQQKTFEQGRQLVGGKWTIVNPAIVVTNALPGFSFHAYGLAVDSSVAGADPYLEKLPKAENEAFWQTYGRLAKAHGFVWGGDFIHRPDRPHVELSYGLKLADLMELFSHGGLPAVFARVDAVRGVPVGQDWKTPVG